MLFNVRLRVRREGVAQRVERGRPQMLLSARLRDSRPPRDLRESFWSCIVILPLQAEL